MKSYDKILCPVDFSRFAEVALVEAAALAKGMGSTLMLLHAYQNPAYVLPMSGYVGPTADMIGRMRQQLTDELEALAEKLRKDGLTVETEIIEGIPYKSIVDRAHEWGADLIVMGTHGRTGLSHALTGSVAERVVRLASCPVLITRSPAEESGA
ncbi:MAG: universal stress protein [Myxococcales bacterium]|nr:universal stress protein [Myxococcales bacterium]